MDLALDDTIAALASAPGPSVRGIVRVAGPQSWLVIESLFEQHSAIKREVEAPAEPLRSNRQGNSGSARASPSRDAARWFAGALRLPSAWAAIPVDVWHWPNGRSPTGQPQVELHLPGSPPVLERVLSELYRRGARAARPGEFTLRAFLAGKLDLLQAEAVLGVIDAADHRELQTALAQLAGGISTDLATLRGDLLELLADLEAGLDFVDEHLEFVSRSELQARVVAAQRRIDELADQAEGRMHAEARPVIVLAGLPNAGKSTLFNRLCGDDQALVSPQRGTTRDFLSAIASADGLPVEIVDTAGWDAAAIGLDVLAQEQQLEQLHRADLVLWCTAADLSDELRAVDQHGWEQAHDVARQALRITTRVDLIDPMTEQGISAITGAGLAQLATDVRRLLQREQRGQRQWLGMTAARCRESLQAANAALERALEAAALEGLGEELLAIELRDALSHLGVIVGAVYTDDLLDRIFSKFCIGK